MTFRYEHEMTRHVERWLKSRGFTTKKEFYLPWGYCDLVGCSFRKENVKERIALHQIKPIGPPLRIMILNDIPDVSEKSSISLQELQVKYSSYFKPEKIALEVSRLERDRFIQCTCTASYYKLNGWAPLHENLVAVELKLGRINEVFEQAKKHLAFAEESFVGLPMEVGTRITGSSRNRKFVGTGIGILGVTESSCEVLIEPNNRDSRKNQVVQTHCVERFWRTRSRRSST